MAMSWAAWFRCKCIFFNEVFAFRLGSEHDMDLAPNSLSSVAVEKDDADVEDAVVEDEMADASLVLKATIKSSQTLNSPI